MIRLLMLIVFGVVVGITVAYFINPEVTSRRLKEVQKRLTGPKDP